MYYGSSHCTMTRAPSIISQYLMASILTNIGAMSALQTLRNISSEMGDTQNRVSSGLRVGQAFDNAA
jgi:hypothetical protein